MVSKTKIILILIGVILLSIAFYYQFIFDPFANDFLTQEPTTVSKLDIPIVVGLTVQGVVIGDVIDYVRMTCPLGFGSNLVDTETGFPICSTNVIEGITDTRIFRCGENIQDDGMIIFIDCEIIRIDTSLCEFGSTDTSEFLFDGRIETTTISFYQCSDNIYLQETSSIFNEGIFAEECPTFDQGHKEFLQTFRNICF